MPHSKRIPLVAALNVLRDARADDEVVVTAMGTAREWAKLASHPLDFLYVPSSMGQSTALGLGIALARPDRQIIAANGDGSMLMNLGSLVSIAAQAPENLTVLVFDNGIYEVTGGQPTPGAAAGRRDAQDVDLTTIALASGFRSVYEFDDLQQWQADARSVIDSTGPTFALLKIQPAPEAGGPRSPGPGPARAIAFREALAAR